MHIREIWLWINLPNSIFLCLSFISSKKNPICIHQPGGQMLECSLLATSELHFLACPPLSSPLTPTQNCSCANQIQLVQEQHRVALGWCPWTDADAAVSICRMSAAPDQHCHQCAVRHVFATDSAARPEQAAAALAHRGCRTCQLHRSSAPLA